MLLSHQPAIPCKRSLPPSRSAACQCQLACLNRRSSCSHRYTINGKPLATACSSLQDAVTHLQGGDPTQPHPDIRVRPTMMVRSHGPCWPPVVVAGDAHAARPPMDMYAAGMCRPRAKLLPAPCTAQPKRMSRSLPDAPCCDPLSRPSPPGQAAGSTPSPVPPSGQPNPSCRQVQRPPSTPCSD